MFVAFCYHKRDSIKTKFDELFYKKSEQEIVNLSKAMNQEVWKPRFEKLKKSNADSCIRIVFVGNSLTFHGISKNIGWELECGMAATSLENDYVHKTVRKISESRNVSVDYAVMNAAGFERKFESFDFAVVPTFEDFAPDYVVFQLGENVNKENLIVNTDLFVEKYSELINRIGSKNSIKMICLPFWHNTEKNQAITKVALNTHSLLVDLSHLGNGLDVRNYATYEKEWKHQGVGMHPGDFGMENIADNIFSVFNAVMK